MTIHLKNTSIPSTKIIITVRSLRYTGVHTLVIAQSVFSLATFQKASSLKTPNKYSKALLRHHL